MSHHQSNVRTAEKEAHRMSKQAMETDGGPIHSSGATTAYASHDTIAHRAYDIYIKSGSQSGHCKANWQKAEHDLRDEKLACDAKKACDQAAAAPVVASKPAASVFPPAQITGSPARPVTPPASLGKR